MHKSTCALTCDWPKHDNKQRWQWVGLLTRDPRDPWPATHDYSRVMTPDCCSFQSGPLSGRALRIKHHHCHKILHRINWIKLTSWLKLCRKSLQCLKKKRNLKRLRWVLGTVLNVIMGQRVTSTDPWPADPLSSLTTNAQHIHKSRTSGNWTSQSTWAGFRVSRSQSWPNTRRLA